MVRPVYLDYNATTPVDPAVLDAMLPYLREEFGNASSVHAYGLEARGALMGARSEVAALIGARPSEVTFTGGGSEADNLAIKGVIFSRLGERAHIISAQTEHPAVLNTLAYLHSRFGLEVTLLPVDGTGRVDPADVEAAIRPNTVLVTLMHANNEVGTLNDLQTIGGITRHQSVLFHVDAAQSAGKTPIDVAAMNIDLLTIAGHKLYAPKGVGALYVRHGVRLDPLIHGSSQEHGLRAGTENVAAAVGLGVAATLAREQLPSEYKRLSVLRDELQHRLQRAIPGLELNGNPKHRLCNTLNVSFPRTTGDAVLNCAPEVAASTGAACHSGTTDPSSVLLAMGLPRDRALGAVRLTLGRMTSPDDVDRASVSLAAAYSIATGAGLPV